MVKVVPAYVLALAILSLPVPAAAVPTLSAHTNVVVFSAESMHVTGHETGYCWTGSIASQRSDAYRCMVGNAIHDPCFTLSNNAVACPVDLAANSGIVIDLSKPLPKSTRPSNAWQMQLTSGERCNIGTGTTLPGFPYYCSGNLVCSAPPPGQPGGPVFVRCAGVANGKTGKPGTYLVTVLYE
jgi:hypothetical protein